MSHMHYNLRVFPGHPYASLEATSRLSEKRPLVLTQLQQRTQLNGLFENTEISRCN